MEENKPTQFEKLQFYAKYVVIIVSAAWVLISGTDLIDKQAKELRLKNEQMSRNSIPLAFHTMTATTDNEPWEYNDELCTITGNYGIKNIGELPFLIEEITFSIFEFKVLEASDVEGNHVTSFTLFKMLEGKTAIYEEVLEVNERVGVEGTLEKNFGYVVTKKRNHNYVIVANAKGGLTNGKGLIDESYLFGVNELVHTIGPVIICPAPEKPVSC